MIVVRRTRLGLLAAFGALSATIAVWSLLRDSVPELTAVELSPAAVETLALHVEPSLPLPGSDDYSIHLPALPGFSAGPAPAPAPAPPPAWRVSAILISGGRPTAIIDDRPVRPGDSVAGGGRVESIDASGVIVVDGQGRRHTLRVGGG